jgi:hypothetical protein
MDDSILSLYSNKLVVVNSYGYTGCDRGTKSFEAQLYMSRRDFSFALPDYNAADERRPDGSAKSYRTQVFRSSTKAFHDYNLSSLSVRP